MRDDDKAGIGQNPADWITAIAVRQDRAAFAALFAFYAPRIKTMLMRMGASADAGEDFAQEALMTVWRKARYFDPDAPARQRGSIRSRAISESIACAMTSGPSSMRFTK
jgi:RNA polymerase sigma-70 factor (ECF subfamily)